MSTSGGATDRIPIRHADVGLECVVPGGVGDRALPIRYIVGIGRNYADHAKEMGSGAGEASERPVMFTKSPMSPILNGEPIVIPRICHDREQVDFEGELAVVIGRVARDVTERDAADPASGIILGYAIANDVSARWWQKQGSGGQFCRGKSFDTFCPIGPWITPASRIAPIGGPHKLRIRTMLNGEVMQDESTASMIFSVPVLVAEISRGATLPAGTVILTGTPAGVGMARTPQRFLKAGDTVAIEIGTAAEPAMLGRLENPVRAE